MLTMKKNITGLLLLWLACALIGNAQADTPKRKIENQKFDLFDTGLGARGCCSPPTGIWLSNNLFAMTSSIDAPDVLEKHLPQVMLVDLETKTSKVLVEVGQLICWNPERQIASIKNISMSGDVTYELIHLDAQGQVGKRTDTADINQHFCQAEASLPPRNAVSILLREPDGAIQISPPGGPYQYDKNAIWIRPGGTPLELNVLVAEVHGAGTNLGNYLAYAQKYLLNTWDSQGNSSTDRRLAGTRWNRLYDLTPYRLMALDGSIEEIPYPNIIFEYGIKRFGYFLPTPAGVVISSNNLLLLQGEKLTRIWPRPSLFGLVKYEIINGLVLSPDGCKLAFRHFADAKYSTLKSVSILNLCEKV